MKTTLFLSLAAAAASLVNAQALEMTGNVPVDFKVAGVAAPAGSYKLVEHRTGLVTVKNADGKNIALANLPVHSKPESSRSFMTFELKDGAYRFAGFCANGRGCWSTGTSPSKSQKIEIALNR